MAEFRVDGLDALILSLQAVADLPVDVQDEMLNAGADVLVSAQRAKVRKYGIYDADNTETRHVAESIQKNKPRTRKGVRTIYVVPKGSRRRGNKVTRNAEILFVNEFGKRGQKARPAVRDATEEAADAIAAAEMQVYDQFLKQHDL